MVVGRESSLNLTVLEMPVFLLLLMLMKSVREALDLREEKLS
jgi:hypothetical protein